MSFEQIVFYAFSSLLLLAAGMVVTARNPVHSALFLVLAFFASSALWLLLEAEFLAITLVLVYVGAVMVLFLFVVMMLDINVAVLRQGFARYLPIGVMVAVLMLVAMAAVVGKNHFGLTSWSAPVGHAADYSNIRELGTLLYSDYLYPLEIAAMLLLVAIVAAIALTLRRRSGTRVQNIDQQVAARRSERVRLVSMSSEERK
jgi:NADH-quinone oxidoreductase subunit J